MWFHTQLEENQQEDELPGRWNWTDQRGGQILRQTVGPRRQSWNEEKSHRGMIFGVRIDRGSHIPVGLKAENCITTDPPLFAANEWGTARTLMRIVPNCVNCCYAERKTAGSRLQCMMGCRFELQMSGHWEELSRLSEQWWWRDEATAEARGLLRRTTMNWTGTTTSVPTVRPRSAGGSSTVLCSGRDKSPENVGMEMLARMKLRLFLIFWNRKSRLLEWLSLSSA